MIGTRVAKTFDGTVYLGGVTELDVDSKSGEVLYRVEYEDGDMEDFNREELDAAIAHYENEGTKVEDTRTRSEEKENPAIEPASLVRNQLRHTMTAEEARKLLQNARSLPSEVMRDIEIEGIFDPDIEIAWPADFCKSNKKRRIVSI